jgi:acetyl-CoA acetyltransferase
MLQEIAIVGIGETPPARRSARDVRALTVDAVMAALEDAGLKAGDIDGIVSDGVVMPTSVPHEWLAAQLGIDRYFDASMSYAGAGTVGAPMLAQMAIQTGLCHTVLCYFGVDWGTRPGGPYAFHDLYPAKLAFEKPYGFNAQPTYFALFAHRYMHDYGLKLEHLAAIAINQRENSRLTGRGQNMKPMTLDDYFNAPVVADPLRYPDCCLISDGAGAFIMTSKERARDCRKRPVYVKGVGFASERISADDAFTQRPDLMTLPSVGTAKAHLERSSGIKLADIDFAELYDCFTVSCLMQLEDLGFCGKGEAGAFVAAGHTRLGGRLPVNTHGGLLSYSYRLAVEHVTEAVRQLRGEAGAVQVKDAELGLVTGLSVPDFAALVLGR